MNPTTYSTLEIHSDAINLLICAVSAEPGQIKFRPLERFGEVLELSSELAANNTLSADSINKLETTLRKYGKIAHRNSGTVFVAASGAVARAANASAVFERLSAAAGETIHLMSAARESALASDALRERMDEIGDQLIIDVGSAFTYVALTSGREIVAQSWLPVGTIGLSAILVGDPPGALSWSLLASRVGFALQALPVGNKPAKAWATGPAAHNLVGLDRKEDQADDHKLCLPDLSALANELMAQPVKKVARHRGEDPRRIVLLPPGLVVVSAILDHYGLSEVTVVPEGLREGIIRRGVKLPETWWKD